MAKTTDYTQTYSGKKFYLPKIDLSAIVIEDIAWALAHQCRFAGHVREFYSVSQHCMHVSTIIKELGGTIVDQMGGLLHDAAEAYIVDIPGPFKFLLPDYCKIEERIHRAVFKKFRIEEASKLFIKNADLISLATEARDLMGNPQDWRCLPENPHPKKLIPCSSADARGQFMLMFNDLHQQLRKD